MSRQRDFNQIVMIKIRYTYTEEQAIQASRQITKATTPWVTYLPIVGVIMIATMIYGWFQYGASPFRGINPLLVGPVFCIIPLLTYREVKKNFEQSPEANQDQEWNIDGETLSLCTKGSSTQFEWNKLVRAKETKGGFLLFPHPRISYWIPKTAFSQSEEINLFRDYLQQSDIPKKG